MQLWEDALSSSSDVRSLVRAVKKHPGVQVTRAGSGHHTVTLNGHRVVTIPTSPSDIRALANCRAELRRAGITLETATRRTATATNRPTQAAAPPVAVNDGALTGRTDQAPTNGTAIAAPTSAKEDTQPAAASQKTAAPVPAPYEEETQVDLTMSRRGDGWIYTRTTMRVRTERWWEPTRLPTGDPRRHKTATPPKDPAIPTSTTPPAPQNRTNAETAPVGGPDVNTAAPVQTPTTTETPAIAAAMDSAPVRRAAREWIAPISYGSTPQIWPTDRQVDDIDRVLITIASRAGSVPVRRLLTEAAATLGRRPEALYGRLYRLAREGRLRLVDHPTLRRKVVHPIQATPAPPSARSRQADTTTHRTAA